MIKDGHQFYEFMRNDTLKMKLYHSYLLRILSPDCYFEFYSLNEYNKIKKTILNSTAEMFDFILAKINQYPSLHNKAPATRP